MRSGLLIYSQFNRDLEDGLRLLGQLSAIEVRMARRAPDALSAADWEATYGVSVAWCDTHEREVEVCRRKLLACRGVPLPHFSDRVGDEVVGQVLTHAWEMQDAAKMVHAAIGRMLAVARIYSTDDDPAYEMVQATVEDTNKPKCWNHMRYGYLTDARGKEPTRVKYRNAPILDVEYRLCEWCEKQVRMYFADRLERRLPNRAEATMHARKVGLMPCPVPAPPGDAQDAAEYERAQLKRTG